MKALKLSYYQKLDKGKAAEARIPPRGIVTDHIAIESVVSKIESILSPIYTVIYDAGSISIQIFLIISSYLAVLLMCIVVIYYME